MSSLDSKLFTFQPKKQRSCNPFVIYFTQQIMSVDATQYSLKKCISKYLEMEIKDNNIKVLFGNDNRGMNERDNLYDEISNNFNFQNIV